MHNRLVGEHSSEDRTREVGRHVGGMCSCGLLPGESHKVQGSEGAQAKGIRASVHAGKCGFIMIELTLRAAEMLRGSLRLASHSPHVHITHAYNTPWPAIASCCLDMALEKAFARLRLRPSSICHQCRRTMASSTRPPHEQSATSAVTGTEHCPPPQQCKSTLTDIIRAPPDQPRSNLAPRAPTSQAIRLLHRTPHPWLSLRRNNASPIPVPIRPSRADRS